MYLNSQWIGIGPYELEEAHEVMICNPRKLFTKHEGFASVRVEVEEVTGAIDAHLLPLILADKYRSFKMQSPFSHSVLLTNHSNSPSTVLLNGPWAISPDCALLQLWKLNVSLSTNQIRPGLVLRILEKGNIGKTFKSSFYQTLGCGKIAKNIFFESIRYRSFWWQSERLCQTASIMILNVNEKDKWNAIEVDWESCRR